MEDKPQVTIYKPDYSLKMKIGNNDISKILNKNTVAGAEKIIVRSAAEILPEIERNITIIENMLNILVKNKSITAEHMSEVISAAFFVKSNAGLCEYNLVTSLAKSLYLLLESRQLKGRELSEKEIEIAYWHIESIKIIMKMEIKKDGADFGKELEAELKRIKQEFTDKT